MTLEEWIRKTEAKQTENSLLFASSIWDMYKENEHLELWKKISLGIFGEPKKDTDDFGLSSNEKKIVDEIVNKCIEYSKKTFEDGNIYLAFLYVFVYREKEIDTAVPVIRIRSSKEENTYKVTQSYFIDHVGRVYQNWMHYLDTNIWSMCWICVPNDAVYLDRKNYPYPDYRPVHFLDQSTRGKPSNIVDKVSTSIGMGSILTMVAGAGLTLFPLTQAVGGSLLLGSAIAGTPTAVYSTGRSIETIIDRHQHKKSINLTDQEARQCWLSIVTSGVSILAFGVGRFLSYTARTGLILNRSTRIISNSINISNISTSGIAILSHAIELKDKEQITPLDYLQFSTNVFFFTHSIITFQTASAIIKDAQKEYINQMRKTKFAKHGRKFNALRRKMRGTADVRNAKFIRTINRIENPDQFMKAFSIRPNYKSGKNNNKFKLNPITKKGNRNIVKNNTSAIRKAQLRVKRSVKKHKQNSYTKQKIIQQNVSKTGSYIAKSNSKIFSNSNRKNPNKNIAVNTKTISAINHKNSNFNFKSNINFLKVLRSKVLHNMKPGELYCLSLKLDCICNNLTKFGFDFILKLAMKSESQNTRQFSKVISYSYDILKKIVYIIKRNGKADKIDSTEYFSKLAIGVFKELRIDEKILELCRKDTDREHISFSQDVNCETTEEEIDTSHWPQDGEDVEYGKSFKVMSCYIYYDAKNVKLKIYCRVKN
ncbi:unnamed protein product [Dimorphilus gyrociliatus]|uniref:DUF4781 domain-containing protein n=1 Tax=Dimorphilus gyrociliatus TaxID=2664684 RepID=A0A7I8WF64_9ANNE|nr:unnamed protein product [Dimorphilus gyrociliatus]